MIQRLASGCAIAAAVAAFALPLVAATAPLPDRIHVRVHATGAELAAAIGRNDTIDYGSMQWLEVDAAELARLRAGGIAVTTVDAPFELDLGGRRFDPLAGVPDFGRWAASAAASDQDDFRLVQFKGPLREADLQALRAAGLEPVQYLHPFTYVVWGSGASLATARQRDAVRWSGAFLPAYRLLPRWRTLDALEREVHVLVYRDAPGLAAAFDALASRRSAAQPIDRHLAVVNLRIAGSRLAELAAVPGVYSVQPVPTDGGLRGEMSNQVNAGNIDAGNLAVPGYPAYLDGIGVHGNGVILADVDGGVYDTHPDLVNRMLPCVGSTCGGSAVDDHGTHTAAIMAGDGSSGVRAAGFLRGLGMAPQARLIEQVYEPTFEQAGGMLKLMTESQRNAAWASGNSWGPSASALGYDGDTRQVDVGVRDADPAAAGDQPLAYVLSIMNGYGGVTSLGTPDEAKNLFAIGSTWMQDSAIVQYTDIDSLSDNSAHGPALDGRSVPAMVAPGCSVDSAISATGFGLMCGTSMASPHVTGASALFVEYYRTLSGGQDPSPALVKAAFSAVAKSLIGHHDANGNVMTHLFDSRQGWGRMQTTPVLAPQQHVEYLDQSVVLDDTGEAWSQTCTADDPGQPMRIMLVWTDAPGHGLGGTTPAWNNDLDLRVTTTAQTFLGNVLDGGGWSQAGGSADARNNMEAVFLQPAQHGGQVTIEVLASDINSDGLPSQGDGTDQDFALVCYNCRFAPPALSDLQTSASSGAAWAQVGQRLDYVVQVDNIGSADAQDPRVNVVAAGLADPALAPGSDWSCGASLGLLNCTHAGVLAAGAGVTLQFSAVVRADAADPLLATFSASTPAAEATTSNNTAQVVLPLLDRIHADGFDGNGTP